MKPRSRSLPHEGPRAEELLAEAGFLQRLSRGLVGGAHDADDLAQDTLVAALEHPPARGGAIRGWLATVAANLARNTRRAEQRREQRERTVARSESIESDERAEGRLELQRLLFDLLLKLPAEQRTVLYLRYYEGRTPTSIADQLGVPLKTVKTRHTRAMTSLRERLDARSGGDRRAWMEALAPAAALHGPGFAGGVIGTTIGGLVVKKIVLVGIAVLLVALAWFAWPRASRIERPTVNTPSAPVALGEQALKAPAPIAEVPTPTREMLAKPAPAMTGALDVHLSWSDGKPAANVGLVAQCAGDPAPRAESFRAITDTEGVARFPALFAGDVSLVPDMRERFKAQVDAGATRTVEHQFKGGTEVRGRVVDPQGGPVANASIWCKGANWESADTVQATNCAADGSFRLRDVSQRATIGARAQGFRASTCPRVDDLLVATDGVREVELRLEASGGRVRGRVLDPEGAPLEHALVLAGPRGNWMKSGMLGTAPEPGTIETDKEGRFEVVGDLEPGEQPIHATARGYPIWEGKVDVVAGGTAFVEIRLERAARIEGRVLGLDDLPIAGIQVIASTEEKGGWYRDMLPASKAVSDEQGRFVLDWIQPGVRELNASDQARPQVGRGRAEVTCVSGQTASCDVHLERGNTIAGRVQDKNGAGLSGWGVYAEPANLLDQWYPRQTKTAADGSFTILNLGEGTHDLLVRSPQFKIAPRARVNRVPVGTKDVVLVVDDPSVKEGSMRARVVDPSGHSLEDLVVTMWPVHVNRGSFLEPDAGTGVVEANVQPGSYRIQIARAKHTLFVSPDFEVREGQVTELGNLTIGALGRVEVRIANLPDELRGMPLSLEGPGHLVSGNLEWKDGVWTSEEVAAGRWLVSSNQTTLWLRGAEIEVPPADLAHVELTLEPAIPLVFTFDNPGAGNITIEAHDGTGKLLRYQHIGFYGRKSSHCEFSIGLPVGHASVEVHTLEGLSGRVDLDVTASLRAPVAIDVR